MNASFRSERRIPVPRDRYRSVARRTGIQTRLRRRPRWLDAAIIAIAAVFVAVASPRAGDVLAAGAADFGTRLAELFPTLPGSKPIELPSGGGVVTADPVAEGLPDFTREPSLKLSGRVPIFALEPGRTVEVTLNGVVAGAVTPDDSGLFTMQLTLREGPNALAIDLLAARDSVVARSSYTVVLDRQPPSLVLSRPVDGEVVDGPNVSVAGKAEPGATVIVNERTIVPAQDGAFSDTFGASAGPLTITVVARDRAGNETTARTAVSVRASGPAAPLTVGVTLSASRVRPGATVIAEIRVTSNGLPKANEQVTLSVGVVTIGSARTDASGIVRIGFAAPPNEGEAAVVVLANGASGRAPLTVAR